MFLRQFLTEYDDSISSELNIDPLGLLVIWSRYGQAIFKNRVSSISNDVRNYTLNLFHHNVIRHLSADDSVVLSSGVGRELGGRKSLAFKQACLIYLENLYTYSMLEAGDGSEGPDTSGVLGVTKGRQRWAASNENPQLGFSLQPKYQVLVRQLSLGVSGRYKTPMIEMGFFDKSYTYDAVDAGQKWNRVDEFVTNQPALSELQQHLLSHLKQLLDTGCKVPELAFSEIPAEIRQLYVKNFFSAAHVGQSSRDFWLGVSELDKGAAGVLLETLDDLLKGGSYGDTSVKEIFAQAKRRLSKDDSEREKFRCIDIVEPFLADVDLLFTLMLTEKSQNLASLQSHWESFDREVSSLPTHAEQLANDERLILPLGETAKYRLRELLALQHCVDFESQVLHLLKYHQTIMSQRGQSPWVRLDANDSLQVQVKQRRKPEDFLPGSWKHHYYIPQFGNLVSGFRGNAV